MLAKTNLPDFTVGNSDIMSSTSTLIGATKNAYVSDRSPYGKDVHFSTSNNHLSPLLFQDQAAALAQR